MHTRSVANKIAHFFVRYYDHTHQCCTTSQRCDACAVSKRLPRYLRFGYKGPIFLSNGKTINPFTWRRLSALIRSSRSTRSPSTARKTPNWRVARCIPARCAGLRTTPCGIVARIYGIRLECRFLRVYFRLDWIKSTHTRWLRLPTLIQPTWRPCFSEYVASKHFFTVHTGPSRPQRRLSGRVRCLRSHRSMHP